MNKTIEINNLNIIVKKSNKKVVESINFKIYQGDVVHLRGNNGSGKSTILKAILNDQTENFLIKGDITFQEDLQLNNLKSFKKLMDFRSVIAYCPQGDDYSGHYNTSILDILLDSVSSYKGTKLSKQEIINLFNLFVDLNNIHSDTKFTLNTNPTKLSGGQKRILSILANILCRPNAPLYIIDEPLNNLDNQNLLLVVRLIEQLAKDWPLSSFIIVSHLDSFKFFNKVIDISANL